jgi:hypothetical protein
MMMFKGKEIKNNSIFKYIWNNYIFIQIQNDTNFLLIYLGKRKFTHYLHLP